MKRKETEGKERNKRRKKCKIVAGEKKIQKQKQK